MQSKYRICIPAQYFMKNGTSGLVYSYRKTLSKRGLFRKTRNEEPNGTTIFPVLLSVNVV